MQYLAKQDLSKLFRTIHAKNPIHHLAALVGFFTGALIRGAMAASAMGASTAEVRASAML